MSYLLSYWRLPDNVKLIACWEHSQNTAVSEPISQQQIEITFIMRKHRALDGHAQEWAWKAFPALCSLGVVCFENGGGTRSEDLKPRQRDERDPCVYISLA